MCGRGPDVNLIPILFRVLVAVAADPAHTFLSCTRQLPWLGQDTTRFAIQALRFEC